MTLSGAYAVMIGIIALIVLIAAILMLRRRTRARRHDEHLIVDMARPETLAEMDRDAARRER